MIEIIPNWHPVFVHFTVALIATAMALFVGAYFLKKECLLDVALWNLWMGSVAAVFTVAAGIYAANTVHHDTPSHAAMLEHRMWALATFVVIMQLAIWGWVNQRKQRNRNTAFMLVCVLCGGLLLTTAWHGGELVYRYGLGVMSLPKGEAHEHSH